LIGSQVVYESREFNQSVEFNTSVKFGESGTAGQSNEIAFSALPDFSQLNDASDLIGFCGVVSESRELSQSVEFTESGTGPESSEFAFSDMPSVFHFNEASSFIVFSSVIEASTEFSQSDFFSSAGTLTVPTWTSLNVVPGTRTMTRTRRLSGGRSQTRAAGGLSVGGLSLLVLLISLIVYRRFGTTSKSQASSGNCEAERSDDCSDGTSLNDECEESESL
jgi:hypothetical protein